MAINQVTLVGRLTRDPELRTLQSGTSVGDLSIAINGREKKGDEWQDRVDYFDVTVWGRTAENCAEYLAKGREVAIAGELRQDRWETDDGDKRSKVKVVARDVQFIGGKGDGGSHNGGGSSDVPADTSDFEAESDPNAPAGSTADDIPF